MSPVLHDAVWKNERVINGFRIGYCVLMGVPSTLFNISSGTGVLLSNVVFLVWLVIGVIAWAVLKRGYHPALGWGLATVDIVLQELGLYMFATAIGPAAGTNYWSALYGVGVSGLGMAALSMARFSWPLALWSVGLSWALYAGLMAHAGAWTPGLYFEGIMFLFFFGILVLNTRRFHEFARLLPAPAVSRIVGSPATQDLGGEEQHATVLFSDLRGFTTLASGLPPARVVALLNAYFKEMVEEVFAHGGTLDKFIGDGLCAVFAKPLTAEQQARAALRCSLGMLERLETLNAGWRARGEPELKIGVGLHCGKLIAGNIGSPMRMEYTHIGDAVNTCSRIEGLTKELGTPVLASKQVVELAGTLDGVRTTAQAPVTARGKSEPLELYAVTSPQ